jgi:membrane protease YdiL (CAAX protease family)
MGVTGKSPDHVAWRGAREVFFWLLLLGSWQFLAASGIRNGIIGCLGTVAFLIFAVLNLDRLNELGLVHARWRSVGRGTWLVAAGAGFIAGGMVFIVASLSSQAVRLSDDRKLILLQVTLGPVLEEILFRGYLFALLLWSFRRLWKPRYGTLAVPMAAVVFAVVHLSQPGTTWLQMACITSRRTLWRDAIRVRIGGTSSSGTCCLQSGTLRDFDFFEVSGRAWITSFAVIIKCQL